MHYLVLTRSYYPDSGSMRIGFEMDKTLVSKGHNITVVCPFSYTQKKNSHLKFIIKENIEGVKLIRVNVPNFSENFILSALFSHIILPFYLFLAGLSAGTQNIISCSNYPLTLWMAGFLLSKIKHSALIIRVDDIHPDTEVQLGLIKHHLIINLFSIIINEMHKKAKAIIVHSDGIKKYLIAHYTVSPSKIFILRLWVDISLFPTSPNPQSTKFKPFENKFIIFFGGLMSYAQEFDTILDAAKLLLGHTPISFILVGKGPQKDHINEKITQLDLHNVILFDFLPHNRYLDLLLISNACLVPLNASFKLPTIPSKIFEIMAAKKPVLLICPSESDAVDIIRSSNCGLHIFPGDSQLLANYILKLYDDVNFGNILGQNGRRAIESEFSLTNCASSYEKILYKISSSL